MGQLSDWFRRLPVIDVLSNVEVREGQSKEGKAYKRRDQVGYLVQVDQYGVETRRRVALSLGRDGAPFSPGLHVLDAGAVQVNQWGELELARFEKPLLAVPASLLHLVEQDSKRSPAAVAA